MSVVEIDEQIRQNVRKWQRTRNGELNHPTYTQDDEKLSELSSY